MNVIYYLIPIALIFLIAGVVAFIWATKSNQFEDMEKHGLSILMDEKNSSRDEVSEQPNDKTTTSNSTPTTPLTSNTKED
jgi:cbb3-type cytochrome oxidase maturation protein